MRPRSAVVIIDSSAPIAVLRREEDARAHETVSAASSSSTVSALNYKRSGHRARLDFGDRFAYALAIESDEPLLYKDAGLTHTDARPAVRHEP